MTKRPRIVIFGGHYHGHIEETLVREEDGRSVPDTAGLSPGSAAHTTILPFNDLDALERALSAADVALVLTEPVMTNGNLIMPDQGFHRGVRELTRRYCSMLCIDEAHTFQFAFGGLSRAWHLAPDFAVLGKGLGSGVSFASTGCATRSRTALPSTSTWISAREASPPAAPRTEARSRRRSRGWFSRRS